MKRFQPQKKTRCQYKGIEFVLAETLSCASLPEMMQGMDPGIFSLDRWKPFSTIDKIHSKGLVERNLDWIRTSSEDVVYGLERWGELIPNNYQEWFALIVIRPSLLTPAIAAKLLHTGSLWGPRNDENI